MRKKLIIILLIFTFLLTSGFGCKTTDKKTAQALRPITLNYWRIYDGPDSFSKIIANYNALHPNIKINYTKLRFDEYEDKLIEAFATDRGPDIFSIHNTWTRKYQSKGLISPMPASITMAYPVIKGSLKKETVIELRTTKCLTTKQIKTNFVDTVYDDVVIKENDPKLKKEIEKIYALPMYVDTLAMYYNNDLFNNAGITGPPEYWNRIFQQNVKKLTKQNNKGEIIQSGVALGGSDNIERSPDILAVLMMQNGTEMMDENGGVRFHTTPEAMQDKNYSPGLDAVRFYADFSNPAKEVYSWNNSLENSLDMFTQNKLAMMFGYSYMLPSIKANAPKLNFSIARLPQIEGNPQNINFANYWVEVVSGKILTDPENLKLGQNYANLKYDSAWDFIQFATKAKQAKSYLDNTKKPTALRELVEEQLEDHEIDVFADQVLTAKSWYRGNDANAAETIMEEMIANVTSGRGKIEENVGSAAKKVQQTVNSK